MQGLRKRSELYKNLSGFFPSTLPQVQMKRRLPKLLSLFRANGRAYTSLPYTEMPVAYGNFSDASYRLPIKGVTIHTTQGGTAGTLAWFNNPQSQVSANYVYDPYTKIMYALLEEFNVPYTNGDWTSNREKITIEVVDNGNPVGVRPESVYTDLPRYIREILQYRDLPINRATIHGHYEESSSHPNCPGNIDLDRLAQATAGVTPSPIVDKAAAYDKAHWVLYNTSYTDSSKITRLKMIIPK